VVKREVPVDEAGADALSWREQAVARSLDSARLRAESRVQRFLDAATELINTGSGGEFTVQEVVERSGQSLRSFYQYFGGKHELLLALFEESVRGTAAHLSVAIADQVDPLERLHCFVVEYYRLCRPAEDGVTVVAGRLPVMAEFAQQLLTTHPKEAARAFAPLATLCQDVLAQASEAGAVRPGLRPGSVVGVVLEVIMFNAFSSTIGGVSVRADDAAAEDELWELIFHGIGAPSA
jgi:AcrR family transcriptional regulator